MSENHSFFVHDDEAVEKLLNREWPEFPLLQQARSCIAGMAGKYCTNVHLYITRTARHACMYLSIWYKFVIEDTCSHV